MCTVINLATLEKQIYTCNPREAVIAAYAQSKKDWNTWDYEKRYGKEVEEGEVTWLIGNFSVYKDEENLFRRSAK